MPSSLDNLLQAIVSAKDTGVTLAALKARFVGKSQRNAKTREAQLRDALSALRQDGKISGPVKHRASEYYLASGHGPSIDGASAIVVREVRACRTKLPSRAVLQKKVIGMNRPFFADAVKHAVASRSIVELACGASRYYLHRDVAAEYFGFEPMTQSDVSRAPSDQTSRPHNELHLEDLLPVYRRLKAEQGGLGTVNISDLLRGPGVEKEALHHLLLREAKTGRLTIHPSTSVRLPPEVTAAGIRLEGYPELFVAVVIKE